MSHSPIAWIETTWMLARYGIVSIIILYPLLGSKNYPQTRKKLFSCHTEFQFFEEVFFANSVEKETNHNSAGPSNEFMHLENSWCIFQHH